MPPALSSLDAGTQFIPFVKLDKKGKLRGGSPPPPPSLRRRKTSLSKLRRPQR